ncbi:uroporphyrinogen-III synthase-like isoform X4 [Macrosteles quadrilineatus]|nr:uroporphyrinogen-III synthase-like isoform X2 [Macrosteles quadrilineatus]XP_054258635.1 uroporphyrinogen-III synthase-like isoform X3 [Macrosteles quadrilineatus]XP_054258636.1 uroporphyrinogen-III synthase-like isoform X2 [Macrosteles quadrilineatus]XP_054258637.1 uroporphyrinogen-III synthase-like isoform X4 [Macrosteles quadrilineatus]XP_054258638.1 uroporphyrinogen-III synthase-like isoform X4 [Macrosteles quadrilineatus]
MKDGKNSVLIFKAIADDLGDKDPYVSALTEQGYSVLTVPVLELKYRNLIVLKEKLDRPEKYGGMILSNPRCVQAIAEAVGGAEGLPEEWRERPAYTVGETTAQLASELLELDTSDTASANAASLASIILKKRSLYPLLLPSGNVNLDTMDRLLSKGGVPTDLVEVYTTVPHPRVEENLRSVLEQSIPHYIVYFSPSGVHTSYPILKEAVDVEKTKWISIGPTTGAAIESYGIKVSASAAKPTPECLAAAIASSS